MYLQKYFYIFIFCTELFMLSDLFVTTIEKNVPFNCR